MEAHARTLESDEQPVTASVCLRLDAFAALDGDGMGTDEGMSISLIPPCALQPAAPRRVPVAPPALRPAPAARPCGPPRRDALSVSPLTPGLRTPRAACERASGTHRAGAPRPSA
jgi:hypothetical protein